MRCSQCLIVSERMISLKQAHTEDFDRIYPLLKGFNHPRLGIEDWLRIFQDNWKTNTGYIGYMLLDDDNVVGFFGLLFSNLKINGQYHNMCNFGNWIVKQDYRANAISMLLPLLRLNDYTITNISASSSVHQIFKKLGFKEIDRTWRILFPLFSPIDLTFSKCSFYEDEDIKDRINGEILSIYRDHITLPKCFHLLVTHHEQTCYILITKTIRKHIPFARIHYISNPDIFIKFCGKIIIRICGRTGTVAGIIDERLLKKRIIPLSLTWHPMPILYKSQTLDEDKIGTIYSEEVVLGY